MATGDAIRRLVTDDLSALSSIDSLVLFFAGHGHTQTRSARDAAADARAWLLGIADKIGAPHYRATFLEAVPEHRRILALTEG
jgi:hypothetical protein